MSKRIKGRVKRKDWKTGLREEALDCPYAIAAQRVLPDPEVSYQAIVWWEDATRMIGKLAWHHGILIWLFDHRCPRWLFPAITFRIKPRSSRSFFYSVFGFEDLPSI